MFRRLSASKNREKRKTGAWNIFVLSSHQTSNHLYETVQKLFCFLCTREWVCPSLRGTTFFAFRITDQHEKEKKNISTIFFHLCANYFTRCYLYSLYRKIWKVVKLWNESFCLSWVRENMNCGKTGILGSLRIAAPPLLYYYINFTCRFWVIIM
jgi:hypothetical protein